MTIRRTKPAAVAPVASRLSRIVSQRRSGVAPDQAEAATRQGGVVNVPDKGEYSPALEALGRARILGRAHRQVEYLHVSDLLNRCIRKLAIYQSMAITPQPQSLSLNDSLTFAQGTAIGETLKERIAAGSNGLMWGYWRCQCKALRTAKPMLLRQVPVDEICSNCGEPQRYYDEVPTKNEQYKIVGSPDVLILREPYNALHITELKSISHDAWKELVRPDPLHVLQVVFYWFLMREAGHRLMSKVSVAYATKGWIFGKMPVKEFVLDAPPEVPRLDSYLKDALQIQETRKGGQLPARPCQSDSVTVAKNCEVVRTCFGAESHAPVEIPISAIFGKRAGK